MANLIPAFTEMKPLDMMSSLKERDRAVSKGPNFLRRFTHGLQNLFLELQTARKFPPSMNVKSFTDESGRIRKSAQLPALSKRYITTNLIGEGTFSQIYAATDSYTRGKVVAVKCLHAGFDILGQREAAYLQFLNRRNARGSRYFVGILEAFYFDNHVCLALEHFRTTLATFMHAVIVAPPAVTISPHLANVHRPVPRSTYMVGSSSGNNSAELKGGSEYTSNPVGALSAPSSSSGADIAKLRKLALSIFSALCLLRKDGIIHADIKPENIFLNWSDTDRSYRSVESKLLPAHEYSLRDLPSDFEVRLGDFGNAIQSTELSEYFDTFEIQTLAYRAPEVLLGLPFNHQVDVYSAGIVILEIWTGQPLFTARTREELYSALCRILSPPPRLYFACGKYTADLEKTLGSATQRTFNFSDHTKAVRRLLSKSRADTPPQLVQFISLLLHPDPNERLTPFDALRHEFLSGIINVPIGLLDTLRTAMRSTASSIATLRAGQTTALRKYNASAAPPVSTIRRDKVEIPATLGAATSFLPSPSDRAALLSSGPCPEPLRVATKSKEAGGGVDMNNPFIGMRVNVPYVSQGRDTNSSKRDTNSSDGNASFSINYAVSEAKYQEHDDSISRKRLEPLEAFTRQAKQLSRSGGSSTSLRSYAWSDDNDWLGDDPWIGKASQAKRQRKVVNYADEEDEEVG